MKNPLVLQREAMNLSQRKLAALARVSRSTVVNNERGFAVSPNPKLLKTLFGSPSNQLYAAYDAFRVHTRQTAGREFLKLVTWHDYQVLIDIRDFHLHPRAFILHGRTLDSLCRSLCIDPFTLRNWLENPHRVADVPEVLMVALREAGVSPRVVEPLVEYNRRHHLYVREEMLKEVDE